MFTGILKNEPAETYHSKKEYISSSPLPEMAKSPLHFFNAWTNQINEPTASMDKGSFIHQVVLEQDIAKYVARPLNEKGELVRSNTKDYAAFLAANPGKTPIHPDLFNEAMAVLSSATSSKKFLKAFAASDKETSFYAKHEETGLYLKARPDMNATDFSFILDVKSTSDLSRFESQIFSLGYDVRLVHYAETIKALTGKAIPQNEFYFFAIESASPYGAKMFRLSPEAVEAATIQWNNWINEIAACQADNKWSGYSDDIIDVSRPAWLDSASAPMFESVG